MSQLPSGTVTFLFTDIEDSARLWDRHPAAMTGALARHDRVVKDAIQQHGGYIFATGGDGFSAAFAQPMQAVDAALEASQVLTGEDWGEVGELLVRMALHTGIADERDGDYFGPPVNRVGRILSVAQGGDVLISQTTLDLLRHHLQAAGLATTDLGQRRLKGIGIPERIYGVGLGDRRRYLPSRRRAVIAGLVALAAVVALGLTVLPTPDETTTSTAATTSAPTVTEAAPIPSGTVQWEKPLGSPSSGLVVDGGMAYVTTREGRLVAYDMVSGNERWTFNALGPVDHPPIVSGGLVFLVGRSGNRLYGVTDGEERLRCSFGFLEPGPPTIIDRTIFLGAGGSGTLYKISSSASTACEPAPDEYPLTGLQTITTTPISAGRYLYLADARGDVIALRLDDLNEQAWPNRYFTGAGQEVGAYDGRVESLTAMEVRRQGAVGLETEVTLLITDAEGFLHFVDGETGKALLEPASIVGAPSVVDNRIYYLTQDALIVVNADLKLEEIPIEGEPMIGPVIDDGVLFYATSTGSVVALDMSSNNALMEEPGDVPVEFLAASDGLVVTVDQEGLVKVVRVPTGGSE